MRFEGKRHSEDTSLSRFACHIDSPPMHLNDLLDERKAKAGPACGVIAGMIAPVEAVENVREFLFVDPYARILNHEVDNLAGSQQAEVDPAS